MNLMTLSRKRLLFLVPITFGSTPLFCLSYMLKAFFCYPHLSLCTLFILSMTFTTFLPWDCFIVTFSFPFHSNHNHHPRAHTLHTYRYTAAWQWQCSLELPSFFLYTFSTFFPVCDFFFTSPISIFPSPPSSSPQPDALTFFL
ncbi:uncharacterized protein EI90DRAFT_965329 [Cantharellus anzutake]|uniref:uncharacterized protein n=1 Tax=Cantharellus anzutake TaxID=1750568 RepID=UPI001906E677|nr:uncharacterized protein EI90DRAFT_965329 [Cantharellus anzutake]KAF8331771.1 hypothetical protein EI90DRAFT_965329 [Cantharellus anzutake]